MKELKKYVALLKEAFKYKIIWAMFPFTLVALALALAFFCYIPVYMLIDLLVIKFKEELDEGNKDAGWLAVAFKYLIAYSIYINFKVAQIMMFATLAVLHFLTYCFLFVASLGKIKANPFAYHE